ncbi:MAG: DnaJ domain-containing protein [Patescibacteria group bacterium]
MTANDFREDFYEQFGIAKFSSADEVKRAYRAMALKHHPDRGGNTQMMQNVNAINEVLTKQKDEYDLWLHRRIAVSVRPGPTAQPTYSNPFTATKRDWKFKYSFDYDEFMKELARRMHKDMYKEFLRRGFGK